VLGDPGDDRQAGDEEPGEGDEDLGLELTGRRRLGRCPRPSLRCGQRAGCEHSGHRAAVQDVDHVDGPEAGAGDEARRDEGVVDPAPRTE